MLCDGDAEEILDERRLLFVDHLLQIVVKVLSDKAWASNDSTPDLRKHITILSSELFFQSLHNQIKEFIFLGRLLPCVEFGGFGHGLLNGLFEHRFVLRHNKYICNAFLHCYCNQMALVLFLDHLVQPLYMDGIKLTLHNRDLSRRSNVHCLRKTKSDPFVFARVCPVYSQRVIFSVILETLDS